MDRLPALIFGFLMLGCGGGTTPSAPAPSRTASVTATPAPEVDPGDFCDLRPDGPLPYSMPVLDAPGDTATDGWGWVNVWATWCSPCIEEMPRIAAWESRLREDLGEGDVVFLSADADPADVAAFRKKRPDAPASVRIASFDALEPWLKTLGLDAAAVLPIHVFLKRDDTVSCIRMGPVHDEHYEAVRTILGGN